MDRLSGNSGWLLEKHLADARQRLIQTGTRNRLIHTARFRRQGKALDIVDAQSDDVFRILARDGRRMRFGHDPRVRETATDDEPLLLPSPSVEAEDEHHADFTLQTRLGQDRLQKKLLGIAREARTLEEEQGINALYIALGFLRWYEEEKSEIVREAPLVLVPVALRRNDRRSTYEVEVRGEDVVSNEPLKHRLKDDFGIRLPDIPETEDWSPGAYFHVVAEAIEGQTRWSIDRDGTQLGFFSFAKLLMVKDLEPEKWPGRRIVEHPIVAGLLIEGFAPNADDFPDETRLDNLFAPADLIQVLDADASQTTVIETVRRGRNLVVQGPPGTGKSQTITNIIAAAAHDRKTVLFVAEKMAALNVVHDRLKAAGLGDVCLELHSRSANKRVVAEELGRTLSAAPTSVGGADVDELKRLRDRLNALADVMHRPVGSSDMTAYRAVSTLIRLEESGFAQTDLSITGVEKWSRQQLETCLAVATTLAEITAKAGNKTAHPFFGVDRADILPMDQQRLKPKLETLIGALRDSEGIARAAAQGLGATRAPSVETAASMACVLRHIAALSTGALPFVGQIFRSGGSDNARTLADAGRLFTAVRDKFGALFSRPALVARIDHLRPMLASGRSFFGRLRSKYRNASAELDSLLTGSLPKSQAARLVLLDNLVELQQATARIESQGGLGRELLSTLWSGDATDFGSLAEAVDWLARLNELQVSVNVAFAIELRKYEPRQLQALADDLSARTNSAGTRMQEILNHLAVDVAAAFGSPRFEMVTFSVLKERARLWLDNLDRLDEWSRLKSTDEAFRQLAGSDIADAVGTGLLAHDQICATIRYIHAAAIYRVFAGSESWATQLTSAEKAELIGRFRDREKGRRSEIARLIRSQHLAGLPRGGMGAMGIVRAEIGKRRGHKPIRRLMTDAGPVVQQIKPIMLMSPISVAQYLPPGVLNFDLLVIDEASQVRPEDALGAAARARQIVVVGDKRQLPPTSFFERIISDVVEDEPEEEDEIPPAQVTGATELESILTLCEARGLSSRMLRWHYRSRHPSLIEVSNNVFYSENGGLILFPSPSATRDTDGLAIKRVNGAYERGGKRRNVIEADAVARAVAEHATRSPLRSLGVVTFSAAQRDTINERLAVLRLHHESLDVFMREGEREEFFVKNIENVQGDERDVIFISVGYGPRVAGSRLDSMAFGPVSTDGGERRLNVLFTRARYRTLVFVSFASADINLDRTRSLGAQVLKRFLEYAETGSDHQPVVLDADPDSDFEVSVAGEIRRLGYEVDHQVGSAGFKIDLAVRRPDNSSRYILAVECDGATYHSAVWARERDRLRQEVLEGLGWRFHRVWSTDWFHRRAEEVRRLEEAIAYATGDKAVGVEDASESLDEEISEDTWPTDSENEGLLGELPNYVISNFPVLSGVEPHEVPVSEMAPIVGRIVEIEGPIHKEEIARRVAMLFGKQKAGSRITTSVASALAQLKRTNRELLEDDGFWLTATQKTSPPLRNRSRAPPTLRKATLLPPIEIAAAVAKVLEQNGAIAREAVPRAVALLFGFQRTGQEFRPAVIPVVESLLRSGKLVEGPGGLQLRSV
jgi:hypothetical protein